MEVMVALVIFSIISIAIFAVLTSWRRSRNISELQLDVEFEARRAMRKMTEEIVQAGPDQITITDNSYPDSDVIVFRIPDSYSGGAITWGDQIQYSLGGNNAEQLLRTNLTTGDPAEIIANNIDSLQITDNIATGRVEIDITVIKSHIADQIQIQVGSQVALRNR